MNKAENNRITGIHSQESTWGAGFDKVKVHYQETAAKEETDDVVYLRQMMTDHENTMKMATFK